MAEKWPYNKLAKDKLTLSLAGLLYNQKPLGKVGLNPVKKPVQPIENEVDWSLWWAEDFRMNRPDRRPTRDG